MTPPISARWLALIGVPVAAALATITYLAHDEAPAVSSPMPPPLATSTAIDPTVGRLHGEVARLRGAIASLEQRASAEPEVEISEAERGDRARDRARRTVEAIERTLATGSRDPAWSADAERRLRDRFGRAAVSGAHLDASDCSSTICRLRVRFDSLDAREGGIEAITDLVDWSSDLVAVADPQDRLRFVMYATRQPGQFPSVE